MGTGGKRWELRLPEQRVKAQGNRLCRGEGGRVTVEGTGREGKGAKEEKRYGGEEGRDAIERVEVEHGKGRSQGRNRSRGCRKHVQAQGVRVAVEGRGKRVAVEGRGRRGEALWRGQVLRGEVPRRGSAVEGMRGEATEKASPERRGATERVEGEHEYRSQGRDSSKGCLKNQMQAQGESRRVAREKTGAERRGAEGEKCFGREDGRATLEGRRSRIPDESEEG